MSPRTAEERDESVLQMLEGTAAPAAADQRCTRRSGCPWSRSAECTDCDGSEAARRARYDATPEVDEQPAASTAVTEANANDCEAPVAALHIARTGAACHDHQGGQ